MLLLAPQTAFRLFFSSQPEAYGEVIPRMAGALTFALGVLVLQVIRHRVASLHSTVAGVRVFLVAAWVRLYVRTSDPFFIVLAAMVGLGAGRGRCVSSYLNYRTSSRSWGGVSAGNGQGCWWCVGRLAPAPRGIPDDVCASLPTARCPAAL